MGLKLEVGKFYRTRDGRMVGPMIRDNWSVFHNNHPDHDLNMQVWNDDGSVYSECEGEYGQTLIAEWPHAPTGPVRTVTRKEIVPGVYGGLEVGQSVNGMVFLAMPIANFGREQIETLIDNLGTVRDALEDQ